MNGSKILTRRFRVGAFSALAVGGLLFVGVNAASARSGADDAVRSTTTVPSNAANAANDDGTPDQGRGDVAVPTTAAPTTAPTTAPPTTGLPPATMPRPPSTTVPRADDHGRHGRGSDDVGFDDHGGDRSGHGSDDVGFDDHGGDRSGHGSDDSGADDSGRGGNSGRGSDD